MLVYGNLLVGVLLLSAGASWGFDGLRDRVRSSSGRRAGVYGTSAIVGTALGLVALGLLAFLSTRYTERFDWSEQGVNSLSEQSLALLADLQDDVKLTAFFSEQDSPLTRDLLERYDYASERLSARFVDPNRRPDLLEAHGIEAAELARGLLLVELGEDALRVDSPSEVDITNALVKLTRSGGRKVYFLEGHNERRIGSALPDVSAGADEAEGRAGFSKAAAALRNETHSVESLLLATSSEVPEDANLVVIAGPTQPFFDEERQALERYLAGGGSLLVMIDPRAQTNLYEDLVRWGVEMGDDVIVDPVMALNRQPTAPVVESYGPASAGGTAPHPIGEKLGRTVFSMARSVSPIEGASDIVPLVLTSSSSWAERDLDGWMKSGHATQDESDLGGPVSIAVAGRPRVSSESEEATPRIVVMGDTNFATNELIDAFGNRDLLLNSVNWLLGDVEHITVRPNVARGSTVSMTAGQLQLIQYLALFVVPEGIAVVGVLAWWLRRRVATA
jgi:ABC-type uncharacterized transport system involved in gliding motility auxiliary subunit